MERVLTSEEKIRRAEEIYQRRRSGYPNYSRNTVTTVNVNEEKNYGLLKKMILQILICFVIYFIFYLIQNSNYIFSEDVLNKAKEILSYDIDLSSMYTQTMQFFQDQMSGFTIANPEENTVNKENTNQIDQNSVDTNTVDTQDGGVGGAELENVIMEGVASTSQDTNQVEQKPQTDDEYIKSNFSFIKPINGIVSSEFGLRNVNNPIVSKNHTGIDVAANQGTVIHAAMEGTVTISSTTGDYGYHIEIQNQDVTTLYGHCSKLYVKQGDYISQGQEIAEVGSTGKSTGPHLHFEIMRGTTYINPRNILDF